MPGYRILAAWLLLATVLLAPDAAAQREPRRDDCRRMRDLACSEQSRAELLAVYVLPTAESRLDTGSEIYRVFIFNAWMRHRAAVTVERSPGSQPTLTLHAPAPPAPRGSATPAAASASVPISIRQWHDLRRRSGLFDRVMVSLPPPPEGIIQICGGHGPLYFVESAEPEADRSVRRGSLGACTDGLAETFAIEVVRLAAEALPACSALEADAFDSTAELLTACALLTGDRLAAAEVYNRMRLLSARGQWRPQAEQLDPLFGAQVVRGPEDGVRPAEAWLRARGEEPRTNFVVERAHGESGRRVVVAGLLRRRLLREEEGGSRGNEEASVQLLWTTDPDGEFVITGMTLGTYAQVPSRCDYPPRRGRAIDC